MIHYRILPFILCIFLTQVTFAQGREAEARDDLDYSSNSRQRTEDRGGDIWYGAGATLGFQASSFSSSFRIGVAPMVGYKFNNFLSFGPRISLVYNNFRYEPGFGQPEFKDNSLSWSAGLFGRAKVFRGFFIHGEYSLLSEKELFADQTGGIISERITRGVPFLGAGLSQGGGPGSTGFEILVLFRVSQRERLNDAPYEIRSGINFNF